MAWKKVCEGCGTPFTADDGKLRWHIEVGIGGEGRTNPQKRIDQRWFCSGCVVYGVQQTLGERQPLI